jgi:hypothetical protein
MYHRVVHRQVLMQQSSPRQMGVDIMVRNHHAEFLATCSELPELDESIGGVMCSLSCLRWRLPYWLFRTASQWSLLAVLNQLGPAQHEHWLKMKKVWGWDMTHPSSRTSTANHQGSFPYLKLLVLPLQSTHDTLPIDQPHTTLSVQSMAYIPFIWEVKSMCATLLDERRPNLIQKFRRYSMLRAK